MNAKKLLALLLALVLCLGILAGCNNDQPEQTTQSTTKATEGTTAATTEATTEATEPQPLKNTDIYPISSDHTFVIASAEDGAQKGFWTAQLDAVGIKAEWRVTASEQTKLIFLDKTLMPDMFLSVKGLDIKQIIEYGQNGLLVNYRDYLDIMPNLQHWIEEYPNLLAPVMDENGNFYCLPNVSRHTTQAGNMFYIRTDLTKAAGIEELPTTIEGFLEMCATLKEYYANEEEFLIFAVNGGNQMAYSGNIAKFFFPFFGDLLQPNIGANEEMTKIEVGFASEQFKRYITFMHTLYAEGYLDPECFTNEGSYTKALTNEGKVVMHNHATQLTSEMFASGTLEAQVYPLMTSEYQDELRWVYPNAYGLSLEAMISTTCPDIESAIKFMDSFYATVDNPIDEAGTINNWSFCLGRYGIDWVIDEEKGSYRGIVPEGYDSVSTYRNDNANGTTVARVWDLYEEGGEGLTMKSLGYLEHLRPYAIDALWPDWLILTDEESDIYADCWTDIKNYVTEMNAAWITGQMDIEAEWDNYLKQLDSMGLQDVIEVYQAALDRYNAAK